MDSPPTYGSAIGLRSLARNGRYLGAYSPDDEDEEIVLAVNAPHPFPRADEDVSLPAPGFWKIVPFGADKGAKLGVVVRAGDAVGLEGTTGFYQLPTMFETW